MLVPSFIIDSPSTIVAMLLSGDDFFKIATTDTGSVGVNMDATTNAPIMDIEKNKSPI